ncbi:hypothetical protein Goshw_010654 [Gossypium schwendimanii]|uniref:Agglutinin domain-containing protein n=1 Tax=Gossypium schwendimanii TaxID=34291 RepID=A0A7J9N180_GOSSC|nr:hypothetical protein [Gossypium schwendimanii]
MTLPRFIVLKSPCAETYLGYKHDNGNYYDYTEFTEPKVVSANAKFEVEFAKDGLVHIRSCTNNKYLERIHNPSITGKPDEEYWITIIADKLEEDRSKDRGVLANNKNVADNGNDIFKVIDWESWVILPRYVAFKGNNDMFLRLT